MFPVQKSCVSDTPVVQQHASSLKMSLAQQPAPPLVDQFEVIDLERGIIRARPASIQSWALNPLRLRGGCSEEIAGCCFGGGTAVLAWAGGVVGLALPLVVGIQNLIAQPSTFNPSGQQNLGLGIAMVVCSVTVFPTAGCLVGSLIGAVLCGGPLLCVSRDSW